jgi:4-amino-4-deoxy-L-arabinose transferase-like glycosyltransferase
VTRRLVARLLLFVLPVLAAGLFTRVYYTPDEPREASLTMAMVAHPAALPTLGGVPFVEKPPLLYWLSAAAVRLGGANLATPAIVRVPNLLYGLLTALSIALIARRAAGPLAGYLAGVVTVTALQLYLVLIWQATDAPLVAGVALSLLGIHTAMTTEVTRLRWRGYGILSLGLLLAFYAKGPAGWMVPGFAYLSVLVFERRWKDLCRPEPWIVVPVLLAGITPWIMAVLARPDGHESLKVMFWDNLVGRAVSLHGPGAGTYSAGHHNSFGKYLAELPLYLLPWTALGLTALVRGWRNVRIPGAAGTAWRLAYGAVVPTTVLLSLAATGRGVYFGPPLLGFALMIALDAGDPQRSSAPATGLSLRVTRLLVALLALGLAVPVLMFALAPALRDGLHIALATGTVLGLVIVLERLRRSRGSHEHVLRGIGSAVGLTLVLLATPLYMTLNRLMDLATVAHEITAATAGQSLALYEPDETTVAMADLYLGAPPEWRPAASAGIGPTRWLWLLPDQRHWSARQWLRHLGYGRPDTIERVPPTVLPPPGLPGSRVDAVIERAGGRRYAILSLTDPQSGGQK